MLRRQVLGVKVVRDDLGAHAVERREMLDRLEERGVRGEVLEVAEMVARHDRRTLRDGDRALQLGSEGEDRSAGLEGKRQGFGRVAARAAQHLESTSRDPSDRVVAADVDRTVVRQQPVDERCEPRRRVVVLVGDGLVAEVAARHDQRTADVREQQMVQRAVGQHQPELGQPRSDGVDDDRVSASTGQHDRSARRRQRARHLVIQLDHSLCRREVADHHRERLVVAGLAAAQLGNGLRVRRVDGKVISAYPLDPDHLARTQRGELLRPEPRRLVARRPDARSCHAS